MTVATEPNVAAGRGQEQAGEILAASHPSDPSGRQRWRDIRWPLLLGLGLVLIAIVSVLASGRSTVGYLDPRAANDQGSRALAELLSDRGVGVEKVTTAAGARAASEPGDLLLVANSKLLTQSQLTMLAGLPTDRLLLAPEKNALRALAPQVQPAGKAPDVARGAGGNCGLEAARLAGNATAGGTIYRFGDDAQVVARCYPAGGKPSLVRISRGGRTTTVVGSASPFMNEHLDELGNAALTMNLTGSAPSVVWLAPDPFTATGRQDQQGRQASPWELMPNVVPLAVLQLGVAVVLIALWRVRRLGRAVPERLPVTVRAAETVEGRARLYRSRRARDRAAAVLREGCRARLAPRLGLPSDAHAQAMVAAVSVHTGWPDSTVGGLLYGSAPEDDTALIRLTDELDALETEVRRQ